MMWSTLTPDPCFLYVMPMRCDKRLPAYTSALHVIPWLFFPFMQHHPCHIKYRSRIHLSHSLSNTIMQGQCKGTPRWIYTLQNTCMNVLLIMTTMLLSPTSHVVSKPLSYTKWRMMFRKVNDIRYDDNKESIREKDKEGGISNREGNNIVYI